MQSKDKSYIFATDIPMCIFTIAILIETIYFIF